MANFTFSVYVSRLTFQMLPPLLQNARAAAVNAFEECHVHDFQRVVKGNTREVTMATKVCTAPPPPALINLF